MNPRNILLILLAVLFAGGTVYVANSWLNTQRDAFAKKEAPQAPENFVLVAKANLPAGTLLRTEHLRWQAWPQATLAKVYIRRTGAAAGKAQMRGFVGAVVRKGIAMGEPITVGRIVKPGEHGFLAAVLHPDMRAIAVRVGATTSAAGFIFPGDRVDLLLTHRPRGVRVSETLLTNIRVLAVDQKTNDQAPPKAKVAKTVTLEVTPKQVEMINVARSLGRLSLSLRALPKKETAPGAPEQPQASASAPASGGAVAVSADGGKASQGGEAETDENNDDVVPGRGGTHTIDAEVSRLLTRGKETSVTIVRGRWYRQRTVGPSPRPDGTPTSAVRQPVPAGPTGATGGSGVEKGAEE